MPLRDDVYDVEVVDPKTGNVSRVRISASNPEQAQQIASAQTGFRPGHVHRVMEEAVTSRVAAMMPLLPLITAATSALALLLAVIALMILAFHDPLGKGLKSYDLSTPEASIKSAFEMDQNSDIRAHLDIDRLKEVNPEDAIRTLDINRTADFGDKKIVFYSYMNRGQKVKKVQSLEKDLESKLWLNTYIAPYTVKATDEKLGKDMEEWETK